MVLIPVLLVPKPAQHLPLTIRVTHHRRIAFVRVVMLDSKIIGGDYSDEAN